MQWDEKADRPEGGGGQLDSPVHGDREKDIKKTHSGMMGSLLSEDKATSEGGREGRWLRKMPCRPVLLVEGPQVLGARQCGQ